MEFSSSRILWYKDIALSDVSLVGGKNASLGEMLSNLTPLGIRVPNGFVVTAKAYNEFIKESGIGNEIEKIIKSIKRGNVDDLKIKGKKIRSLILDAKLPKVLHQEISDAYQSMGALYGENPDVAVRSSATAEDLPGASFAGQQETFLNVSGVEDVLLYVKKCFASLYTDRAISYRHDRGFSHMKVALSVGIQKMVRSDLASSGICFTIDTETGFNKVITVTSSYGLGELIVQGEVTPDEFTVFKPLIDTAKNPIITKKLGQKNRKLVYDKSKESLIKEEEVAKKDQEVFSLSDAEVVTLADWCNQIERYFSKKYGHYQPMDIEWAKDGKTNQLFIVQARPETVQATQDKQKYEQYVLAKKGMKLLSGVAVGTKIASGAVRILKDASEIDKIKKGEVLVTEITDPDWEPIMRIASAIITDKGGRTSHAAIVSRELGIPAIVGTGNATSVCKDGEKVTVDCSSGREGIIYQGILQYKKIEHKLTHTVSTKTKIMVNIGSPEEAFTYHYLPVKGVGLGRLEFIISEAIKVHPNALLQYEKLVKKVGQKEVVKQIDKLTYGFEDKKKFYIDTLASGIARIAAVYYPHDVIIRFSDFKSNEYRKLIGGSLFEPEEENPMIGWRGSSRYYHPDFKEAFMLECQAIKKVRYEMGLSNVIAMVPFCRTVEEAKKVIEVIESTGLSRKKDRKFKLYMMCEIPSNVILAEEFLKLFDGMSIGSNDLSQLTLGLDRDSEIVNSIGNENNDAVKTLIGSVIDVCRKNGKYVGICGQAPSDFPEFTKFLINKKIESISLNPDVIFSTIKMIASEERK